MGDFFVAEEERYLFPVNRSIIVHNLVNLRGPMLRKLGILERAMLVTNRHAPFNIVSVLRMESAPSPDKVKAALGALQKRHPLLGARIVEGERQPYFESLPSMDFTFKTLERTGDEACQTFL